MVEEIWNKGVGKVGGGVLGGWAEASSASPAVVEELCIHPKVYKRQTIVTN